MEKTLIQNKTLLIETTNFTPKVQVGENKDSRFIVTGVLGRADDINENKRIYKKKILENAVKAYKSSYIAENRAMGELDHPDTEIINLQTVSHNVLDVWWEGNEILGKVEILETPCGEILKNLFKAGLTIGISSRGLGSVKQIDEAGQPVLEVQDDYEIIAWDFVSNPSTKGGFMHRVKIKEGKETQLVDKYYKINNVINSILGGNKL